MLLLALMNRDFFIDHHIQSSILGVLMHKGPRSFSSLKPDDLENSLFMYHMRKLIARGIVEKRDGHFVLTAEGVRWINKTGVEHKMIEGPRCLVQFIIIKDNKILISERLDHIAEHINRYVLPGGLHKFGLSSLQSAESIAQSIGTTNIEKLVTHYEIIIPSHIHHALVDVYLADVSSPDFTFKDDFYNISFIKVEEVLRMTVDEAGVIPAILKKYLDKSLKPIEEFIF